LATVYDLAWSITEPVIDSTASRISSSSLENSDTPSSARRRVLDRIGFGRARLTFPPQTEQAQGGRHRMCRPSWQ